MVKYTRRWVPSCPSFSVRVSGLPYTHNVQPCPPSSSRTLRLAKWGSSVPAKHSSRLPLLPPCPQPWQPPSCFLSLGIGLPQGPPRSGIRQGLSLLVWLLSRSSVSSGLIHVVAMPGFLPHLRLESVPSQGWTTSRLSTGHLGCFHLPTAVDHAAVNIGVQTSV